MEVILNLSFYLQSDLYHDNFKLKNVCFILKYPNSFLLSPHLQTSTHLADPIRKVMLASVNGFPGCWNILRSCLGQTALNLWITCRNAFDLAFIIAKALHLGVRTGNTEVIRKVDGYKVNLIKSFTLQSRLDGYVRLFFLGLLLWFILFFEVY